MDISKLHNAQWQCRLLIFSGRPNPVWPVAEEQAQLWQAAAEAAAPHHQQSAGHGKLGYQGVVLDGPGVRYVFFEGRIACSYGEPTVYNADIGRALEKAIIKSMPEVLKASLPPLPEELLK
jgi:hypothetical protein